MWMKAERNKIGKCPPKILLESLIDLSIQTNKLEDTTYLLTKFGRNFISEDRDKNNKEVQQHVNAITRRPLKVARGIQK